MGKREKKRAVEVLHSSDSGGGLHGQKRKGGYDLSKGRGI